MPPTMSAANTIVRPGHAGRPSKFAAIVGAHRMNPCACDPWGPYPEAVAASSHHQENSMSFLSTLRAAFKGGGGERVPLARNFVSPWSWAHEPAGARPPFEYRNGVRHAFLDN